MSGAEDLARLTGTIDILNEITISPEIKDVDVGNGETRPTVTKALSIAATQFGGAMPYTSIAVALASTVNGTVFSVPSKLASPADPLKYIDMYLNDGGVAVPLGDYPSGEALRSVEGLIRKTAEAADYFTVASEEGAVRMAVSAERLHTEAFDIRAGTGVGFINDEGGMLIYADSEKAYLGPLEIRYTDAPGTFFVNEYFELVNPFGDSTAEPVANLLDSELLFAPVIAVGQGDVSRLYPASMLGNRESASQVVASVFSSTTVASDSGAALTISDQYGSNAVLTLRQEGSSAARATMPLTIKVAPVQAAPKPLTVLFVGDSIGNNQGAFFLNEYLVALGYAPSFIGTIHGAAINSRYDTDGPLGECRSGWQLGDYLFTKGDRALIVEPGQESAYLTMEKEDQITYNPLLRAAVAGDDPALVRNGYVFDLAYYQSRFGLSTPDVVVNALGTNEATSLPAAGFYSLCYENEKLFNQQVSAAWPNAKIVRTVPGTGIDPVRSPIWSAMYTPLIRAMRDAATLNSKVGLAPLWAMMNPDIGFPLPTTVPGQDGFRRGTWSDPVHPSVVSRREYYKAMAPFVAVAALNL